MSAIEWLIFGCAGLIFTSIMYVSLSIVYLKNSVDRTRSSLIDLRMTLQQYFNKKEYK